MERQFKPNFKNLPTSPGVYQFISDSGAVLYIGKAKNIRNRIKSYYLKDHGRGPKIDLLLEAARDLRVIETESEIEAILLEAELIKKILPKYNTSQKDDKSYLLVKFSKDEYPRLIMERYQFKTGTQKELKSAFGPYPSGDLLKKSFKYLRKLFPYRDCNDRKYNACRKKDRACLYGDINLCLAPCVGKTTTSEYNKQIWYLKEILSGKKKRILQSLYNQMNVDSKNKNYENAAKVRDKIYALEHLKEVAVGLRDDVFDSSKILFNRIECYDISNILGQYAVGSMSVVANGEKATSEYRKFKIKTVEGSNDVAMISEVLKRRLKNDWPLPDLIVIDGGLPQLNAAIRVLKDNNVKIPLVSIAKGVKRDKNEFHFNNSDIAKYIKSTKDAQRLIVLSRDEAHRFAIGYYRLLHKKGMLEGTEK